MWENSESYTIFSGLFNSFICAKNCRQTFLFAMLKNNLYLNVLEVKHVFKLRVITEEFLLIQMKVLV